MDLVNPKCNFKFDTHSFFMKGYTWGFVPQHVADECRKLISETNFINASDSSVQQYADWASGLFTTGDEFFYEILRNKMTIETTPYEFKNIGNMIIKEDYFDTLRARLVKPQHRDYTWMRSIKPYAFGLWNKTEELPWHTDNDNGADLTILMYFNSKTPDPGSIHFGIEDEQNNVEKVYSHPPVDQTFVCINNMNPYFKHSVDFCNKERYVLSFSYRFE